MLFNQHEVKKIPRYSGIYEIIAFENRSYIGESVDIHRRLTEHLHDLRKRKHFNKTLQDLYIISDWDFIPPLEFNILEVVEQNGHTKEHFNSILISKERDWMRKRESTLLINQFNYLNYPMKKKPTPRGYQKVYTISEIENALSYREGLRKGRNK